MYRLGHLGASLLAYAPLGVAVALAIDPTLAAIGGLVALALATVPDADEYLPIPHRGPTHSIAFVVVSAVVVGVLAVAVASLQGVSSASSGASSGPIDASTGSIGAVCGVAAAISLSSHLAADSVTPMGIKPFWPVSDRHYTFDLTPAKNPRANLLLFVSGVGAAGIGAVIVLVI